MTLDLGQAKKPVDLLFVEQQAAGTFGFVLLKARARIGLDVHVVRKHLAVFHAGKRIGDIGETRADRFDLSALELDAGFETLENVVVPQRFAVDRNIRGLGMWRRKAPPALIWQPFALFGSRLVFQLALDDLFQGDIGKAHAWAGLDQRALSG